MGKVKGGVGGTLSYHLVPTVLRHITKSLNRAGLRTLRVDLRRDLRPHARLRKIEIDPKKSSNVGLCASAKKKRFIVIFLFNYIPLVGNMPSVLQTSLLAILMIVKNQFKKGNGENIFFFFSRWPSPKC